MSRAGVSDQALAQVKKALGEGGWLVRKYNLNREGAEPEVLDFGDFLETISTPVSGSTNDAFLSKRRASVATLEILALAKLYRPAARLPPGQQQVRTSERLLMRSANSTPL
jgi:hypothetical protein